MGNSNDRMGADASISKFYLACSEGDVDAVKRLLLTMKLKDINRIESNGSTALHAAASHGHLELVQLLLQHGCSTITVNRNGKTAAQECSDEQIRQLIESSRATSVNSDQLNEDAPNSKWYRLYENVSNENKSSVATKILKMRLRTYLTQQFKINGPSRAEHLKQSILQYIPSTHPSYAHVSRLLNRYITDGDPSGLLTVYTLETPFYRYASEIEVYAMELLVGLMTFKNRFYIGTVYRGIKILASELVFYKWACDHPTCFIELRSISSSTKNRLVSDFFARYDSTENNMVGVLMIIHFTEQCHTAIDLTRISSSTPSLSEFDMEEEVVILPGTFFEVVSIEQPSSNDSSDPVIMELKNIPVSHDVLRKTINELK
ncbi:unnamed protein product [Adineta ricciae]|uniref:Uncharacterized protein n=1 Tax=Adineta ricciae TaxID=249248 RepID=A0A814MYU8_ADIRI|nr:unnamed protein product [Adineta ricciae]